MAYCSSCGAKLDGDYAQFCAHCGARTSTPNQNAYDFSSAPAYGQQSAPVYDPYSMYGQQPVYGQGIPAARYGMKWYKFLIYFALFAAAVLDVVSGLLYITGSWYTVQSAGQVDANLIYFFYGNGLKVLDICMGLVMIAIAGFTVYTRFCLSQYRVNGPTCLYILYAANAVIVFLYSLFLLFVTGINQLTESSTIVSVVTSIAMVFINRSYFTKRKAMFRN